ncbi:hypothetical protein [Nitrosomonas eutropha]|uniref:hypothetical protein n=1 Tax=Nitrosomonas eutropha TaxID=916 RepID=UPI0008ACEA86|nr:hypothetical protein [Nitrosomonas eutropha]SEI97182.1 hypothetical protein SAMN05216318_11830 [Nitrosomonas eutropha]
MIDSVSSILTAHKFKFKKTRKCQIFLSVHPRLLSSNELPHYQMDGYSEDSSTRDTRSLLPVRKIEIQEQLTAAKQVDMYYPQGGF